MFHFRCVQCNSPPEENSDCRSQYLDIFYRPKVVVVYPCYHCWFTDSFKDPYTCTFTVALLILMLGMMKMLCMFCCCRTSDGRYVDIAAMLLGTASEEHTRVYVSHYMGLSIQNPFHLPWKCVDDFVNVTFHSESREVPHCSSSWVPVSFFTSPSCRVSSLSARGAAGPRLGHG